MEINTKQILVSALIVIVILASLGFILRGVALFKPEEPIESRFSQIRPIDFKGSNEEPLHTSPVFLPGTQPHDLTSPTVSPTVCKGCHGGYADYSPYDTWKGSMMSFAAMDPLFLSLNAISNRDLEGVVGVGDYCLRCHTPGPWLEGRSEPVDGSALTDEDLEVGVTCDFCHRLVDPLSDEGRRFSRPDTNVYGNGQYVVSPFYERRGPYNDAQAPHDAVYSEFHSNSDICATCHDIYNPVYDLKTPVETTYSEWKYSAFSKEGIECQDCHMPVVKGYAAYAKNIKQRDDIYKHEFVGASTWMPDVLIWMYDLPDDRVAALKKTQVLAGEMLKSAAKLELKKKDDKLVVNITNLAGHKLPTGYPEGKRMWINVKFFDASGNLISESGRYDAVAAELFKDKEFKVYEAKPGLKDVSGYPDGPSFHFALNNWIYKDNRIPPRGFTNAEFEASMAYIREAEYMDGQYWDITEYKIPARAVSANVTLRHQSVSKEFVTFLRDKNVGNHWDVFNAGQRMYEAWEVLGKSPPFDMATASIKL